MNLSRTVNESRLHGNESIYSYDHCAKLAVPTYIKEDA